MPPQVNAADRRQIANKDTRLKELNHYLAKLIGLVGVISPVGISSAITERQTPLPTLM
jgi:hypothetical protein